MMFHVLQYVAYLRGGGSGRCLPPLWSNAKIVGARCNVWRQKCTKFDFGWDCAPDLAGGAYNAPPDALVILKGPKQLPCSVLLIEKRTAVITVVVEIKICYHT